MSQRDPRDNLQGCASLPLTMTDLSVEQLVVQWCKPCQYHTVSPLLTSEPRTRCKCTTWLKRNFLTTCGAGAGVASFLQLVHARLVQAGQLQQYTMLELLPRFPPDAAAGFGDGIATASLLLLWLLLCLSSILCCNFQGGCAAMTKSGCHQPLQESYAEASKVIPAPMAARISHGLLARSTQKHGGRVSNQGMPMYMCATSEAFCLQYINLQVCNSTW